MMIIIALFFCWNLRNPVTAAVYHDSERVFSNTPLYFHHYLISSSRPNFPYHFTQRSIRNPVLRSAPSQNQLAQLTGDDIIPLGGAGITLPDDTTLIDLPTLRSLPASSSTSAIIPSDIPHPQKRQSHLHTGELEVVEPKRKKLCGSPSVATRALADPHLKRSFFAFTQDEVDEKVKSDEYRQASERRKRELQHKQIATAFQSKRTEATSTQLPGADLPWTCQTTYEWRDMGIDHYPRFVRTAECKTRLCFNGFFRCRPRRYKTKVLKRVTPSDSTSCEEDDVSLPESLRQNWKFVTVTINLCCDCTGRIPGTT